MKKALRTLLFTKSWGHSPAFSLPPTPTAWYNLDEASGTRADAIGALDLTEEVGAASSAAGLIGDAVDGSDNVRLRNDSFTIASGTPFSISVWVYWVSTTGANNGIVMLYPNSDGAKLGLTTTANNVEVAQAFVANGGTLGLVSDTWNHIVFGFDGENTVFVLNGGDKTTLFEGAPTQTFNRLWVGSENTNSVYRVDLLGYWNDHFLTDSQIDALYNSGVGLAYPFN